mgnify:CR=1 FL=1
MQKKTSFSLQEAQKKLEHYCAYQERCHWEVEQKLKQMGMIPSAQELIITKLIEENYLNETKAVVKVIQKRLDTFANLEHIDQLKNVLLPRVQ